SSKKALADPLLAASKKIHAAPLLILSAAARCQASGTAQNVPQFPPPNAPPNSAVGTLPGSALVLPWARRLQPLESALAANFHPKHAAGPDLGCGSDDSQSPQKAATAFPL